jgi:hypothetical protein
MPICGRDVERRDPMRALVVDEGLRALCRQQRENLRCVTITRGLEKLLPRHGFPAPSLCFLSLFPCNLYGPSVRPHALICKQGLAICQGINEQSYRSLAPACSHSRWLSTLSITPLQNDNFQFFFDNFSFPPPTTHALWTHSLSLCHDRLSRGALKGRKEKKLYFIFSF